MSKEDETKIGVTTGSLATAAALASLVNIVENVETELISIDSPKGELNILVESVESINPSKSRSVCIKYPYSDPDVTVGLDIVASVELRSKNGNEDSVEINGGFGVGIVKKPGLQIPIGEAAINPVPREMIKKNLEKHVPEGKKAIVEISIPKGKEIASKTMNPRLGIEDGISILGTTGIAKAMDDDAYKNSIVKQLDVAKAEKIKDLVFVPGNIGEKLALKNLSINEEQIVQTGNYIGFMFDEARKRELLNFTLFGHIGKLVKVAGGIFNTKHAVADGRCEIFAAHTALYNSKREVIRSIFDAKTTEEIINILEGENLRVEVLNSISEAIKFKCKDRFDLNLDVILVDMEGNILNTNYSNRLIKSRSKCL